MAIFSNPLYATYSVYARNTSIAVEIAAPSLYSTSLDCRGQRFSHCAEAGNALVRCN